MCCPSKYVRTASPWKPLTVHTVCARIVDGHKKASNLRRGQIDVNSTSIWLTLISELPEAKRHLAVIASLQEAGPPMDDDRVDSLAAALVEYADLRQADCEEVSAQVSNSASMQQLPRPTLLNRCALRSRRRG